jgi:hypothetical protein
MALRLAQLPLVFDCPRFEPVSADDGATTCVRCREVVHDLSALTEAEVRRFFSRNAGRAVCVSVQVDRGGSLVLRDTPWALPAGVGLFALLAAAGCAGVYDEGIETPELGCHDVHENAVACEDPDRVDYNWAPDAAARPESTPPPPASGEPGLFPLPKPVPPPATGCPVPRPNATASDVDVVDIPNHVPVVVQGILVAPTLFPTPESHGYMGTRQALPEPAARRERRAARRRLHGR